MDFARSLVCEESVVSRSKIRYIPLDATVQEGLAKDQEVNNEEKEDKDEEKEDKDERKIDEELDRQVIQAANRAAIQLFLGPTDDDDECSRSDRDNPEKSETTATTTTTTTTTTRMMTMLDCTKYPERLLPRHPLIQSGDLVVIQEAFDKLDFVYATPGQVFYNRNGQFPHDDFIGKPFGCKIRSRNNRGYGYLYLLKPTPELWVRSLNHRTQIVHELDSAQIVFQLHLRPNMMVVESGTGSTAMSHSILRCIAPRGHLHTYEFNRVRAETARAEFAQNGIPAHLVTVHHGDVCSGSGGFAGLSPKSVDAVFLDLPEPWRAVSQAAIVLKYGSRIASYSPCVEQTQRTVAALEQAGFHSLQTMEYRLQEHYVDQVEYEPPPTKKRLKLKHHLQNNYKKEEEEENDDDNDDEIDVNDKEEATSSAFKNPAAAAAAAAAAPQQKPTASNNNNNDDDDHHSVHDNDGDAIMADDVNDKTTCPDACSKNVGEGDAIPMDNTGDHNNDNNNNTKNKRKKTFVVARPFVMMRGHTAYLTFATLGRKKASSSS